LAQPSGDNKGAMLADRKLWSPKFAEAVKEMRLDSPDAQLTCESFDCLEISYPRGAPSGWIGSTASIWNDARSKQYSCRPFPKWTAQLRALNFRYNFNCSPAMVRRHSQEPSGPAEYVLPALPETIIYGGDQILIMFEGPPGTAKFDPDQSKHRVEYWQRLQDKQYLEDLEFVGLPLTRLPRKAWADEEDDDARVE